MVVAAVFHTRIRKRPTPNSRAPGVPWQKHMLVLYVASGLIMLRSIVRVVEFMQGSSGYVISHEVFLYLFDSLPMLGVMALFNLVHASGITKSRDKQAGLIMVMDT